MGTMIQKYKLTEADFRGERFKESAVDLRGNNDLLTLSHCRYLPSVDCPPPNRRTLKTANQPNLSRRRRKVLHRQACAEKEAPVASRK